MVAEHVTVYRLLAVLCERQANAWFNPAKNSEPDPQALSAYQQLVNEWAPLRAEEVEKLAQSKSALDLVSWRRAVYLPPAAKLKHFAPLLTVYLNVGPTDTELKLRLMLVSCAEDCELYGLGYRMEFGTEEHDFPHAQLVRDFYPSAQPGRRKIDCPIWLPQTQPSFPIPASDTVTLLLTMLMSLYGLEFTQHFDTTTVPGIGRYVNNMMQTLRPSK